MRRLIFSIAAAVALISCQKEVIVKDAPVFTAEIYTDISKTTITSEGKISWNAGDEITVADANGLTAVYVAESAGASTTFRIKSGQQPIGGGPYQATYGSCPTNQEVSAAGIIPPVPMFAETTGTNFVFTATYGLLKLTLKSSQSKHRIGSIMVKGDKTDLYTLTITTPQEIYNGDGKTFYMVLPAGRYRRIYLNDVSDDYVSGGIEYYGHRTCIKTLKSLDGFEIKPNVIRPVSLVSLGMNDFDCIYMGTNSDISGYPLCWATGNIILQSSASETYAVTTHPYAVGRFFTWGGSRGYSYYDETTATKQPVGWKYSASATSKFTFNVSPGISGDLDSSNDTATKLVGDEWRMPTNLELNRLGNLDHTWTESFSASHPVPGIFFTAANGNKLFLPAAGRASGDTWVGNGTYGYYQSTKNQNSGNNYCLVFHSSGCGLSKTSACSQTGGFVVRAVKNDPPTAQTSSDYSVLIFGHSFGQDCTEYLPAIAKAAGVKNLHVGRFIHQNCSLNTHYNYYTNNTVKGSSGSYYFECVSGSTTFVGKEMTATQVLESRKWDVVIFQESLENEGNFATVGSKQYLLNLINAVTTKQNSGFGSTPTFMWNMFWPISTLCEPGGKFEKETSTQRLACYDGTSAGMWSATVNSAKAIVADADIPIVKAGIIPTGTAVMNARADAMNVASLNQFTRDGYHMSYDLGRYLVACTMFQKLYSGKGYSVQGNSYRVDDVIGVNSITNDQAGKLQTFAVNAVATPY